VLKREVKLQLTLDVTYNFLLLFIDVYSIFMAD